MPDLTIRIKSDPGSSHADLKKLQDSVTGAGNAAKGPSSMLGGLGDVLGKVGLAAMGAQAVFGAVTGAVSGFIGPAMEAQQITAQLQSVLASTGGKAGVTQSAVEALSTSLGRVTMFEDDAITSAQSLLLTFTNIGQDVFPAATETVLNMSQALGTDLKGSSMLLGKALNDPIAGIGALRKVGVQLSEQQEEQIKTMMAAGDVAGAQGVILGELGTQFGGAAKAAGQTFAGSLTILQNELGNVVESIGGPVVAVLGQLLTQMLPLAQQFGDWLPGAIATFMAAMVPVGEFVTGSLIPALVGIGAALAPVVSFISDNLIPLAAAAGAAFIAWATVTLVTLVPAFILWATTATAAAAATVIALAPVLLPIAAIAAAAFLLTKAWQGNWGDIQGKTAAVWSVLKPIFEAIVERFTNLMTNLGILKDFFVAVAWPAIAGAVTAAWDGIIKPVFAAVMTYFETLGKGLEIWRRLFVAGWELMSQAVTVAWEAVILPAWDLLLAYFETLGKGLVIWRDLFTAGWELISGAVTAAWDVIIKPAFDLIVTHFTTLGTNLGILRDLFTTAWTAISTAVKTAWDATIKVAFDAIGLGFGTITTILETLRDLFGTAWTVIGTAITTAWNTVIKPTWDLLGTGFGTITTTLNTLGDLFGTVWTAISGAVDTAWKAIAAAVNGGIETLKAAMSNAGSALVSLLQTSFTRAIDAFRTVVAQKIAEIAALLPHSLAKTGPLSVPTNWETVLEGNLQAVAAAVIGQFREVAGSLTGTLAPALDDSAVAADGLVDSLSPLDGVLSGLTSAVGAYGAALLKIPTSVTTSVTTTVQAVGAMVAAGVTGSSSGGGGGGGSKPSGPQISDVHAPQFDWGAYNAAHQGEARNPDGTVKRAGGGRVLAGYPYWVGEEGPEPFVPDVSGYVLPNKASRGGGMSGNWGGGNVDVLLTQLLAAVQRMGQQPIVMDHRVVGSVLRSEGRDYGSANLANGVGGMLPT